MNCSQSSRYHNIFKLRGFRQHTSHKKYKQDLHKLRSFFHMLREIQKERRQILGGGNYRQYLQLQEGKLPALLLMIDDYAAFREKTGERYEDDLIRLAREGGSPTSPKGTSSRFSSTILHFQRYPGTPIAPTL